MLINLSPLRCDTETTITLTGDLITVNGEVFDFSPVPEGALLPSSAVDSDFFIGDVTRIDGQLNVTIRLGHGANAPEETRFPEPIVTTKDGPVTLPPFDIVEVIDEH